MATVCENVAAMVNADARWRERGFTATGEGATCRVVRDGAVEVVATWIGADAFVVSWRYEGDEWRAVRVESESVALEVAMTVDALAFG